MQHIILYLFVAFVFTGPAYCMNTNKKLENNTSFIKIIRSQEADTKNICQAITHQPTKKVPIHILYCNKVYYDTLNQGEMNAENKKELEKISLKNLTKKNSIPQEDTIARIRSLLYNSIIDINEVNEDGETPLFEAIKHGNERVVKVLLMHESIDVNKTDDGIPPLLLAAYCGYKNIVKLLLKHGADCSYSLNNEKTAYDIAVENNHQDIVALLDFYKYMVDQKLIYLLSLKLEDIKLEELQNKIGSNYILEYLFFIAQNENEKQQAQEMYNKVLSFRS